MNTHHTHRALVFWLFGCAALVFLMVVVGGITRLTNSGLSMVEWRPLMGFLPPMHEDEWMRVFNLYQNSPEYAHRHFWMELDDFKAIFFWEWFHRLLGRLVGVAYGLPLVWFWIRGKIPQGYKLKLIVPFLLGGAQGFMGWYMVKSGLVDRPDVSHFRLAAHLSLAFVIISTLLWLGLDLKGQAKHSNRALLYHGLGVFILFVTTILWGAFTAGLDAGMIYNDSFPKMGDQWIPNALISSSSFFETLSHNHEAVQFFHRWLAIGSVLGVLSLWAHARMKAHSFKALHLLAFMVFAQLGLGIATLFSSVALPLAALHQSWGLLTLLVFVVVLRALKPSKP